MRAILCYTKRVNLGGVEIVRYRDEKLLQAKLLRGE